MAIASDATTTGMVMGELASPSTASAMAPIANPPAVMPTASPVATQGDLSVGLSP